MPPLDARCVRGRSSSGAWAPTALRMAAEALPSGIVLENAASGHECVRGKGSSGAMLIMAVETLPNGDALENAASGHEMCPRQG